MFFTRWLVAVLSISLTAAAECGDYLFLERWSKDLTPLDQNRLYVAEGGLALIDGGKATLPIVYDDDDRGGFAAAYLGSALTEMTGAEFEVYRRPRGATNSFDKCIYLPRPGEGDDFAVEISAKGVVFSGRTDFAAFDFCERLLGVRHYWDGEGGRSVPRIAGPVLPLLRYSDSPVFSFRRYSSNGAPPWLRVAKAGGTYDGWTRCHTTDGGFCYGSPEGFAEYCRRVDADIAGGERFLRTVDRDRKVVSVSPWDVAYRCPCRWCRTLFSYASTEPGAATPVVWGRFLPRFAKYMAERHPDYRVAVLPYWNYVTAPRTIPALAETNVFAEVCSMSGLAAFKWDRVREREEGIILDWERLTGHKVANWHYSCWPAEYTDAPYVYGRTIASHYRRLRDHVAGSFICGGKDDFPRFALSLYVWMRCLWNPDIDVDAVYDVFCERMFGPAAAPMRELTEIQETEWRPETFAFPPEAMARMSRLLNESAALVRGTPYAKPFRRYLQGFSAAFEIRKKK